MADEIQIMNLRKCENSPALNKRFGAMAAVTRRQFYANLHVITPQQVRWKPPLRQAAGTLYAMGERQCVIQETF